MYNKNMNRKSLALLCAVLLLAGCAPYASPQGYAPVYGGPCSIPGMTLDEMSHCIQLATATAQAQATANAARHEAMTATAGAATLSAAQAQGTATRQAQATADALHVEMTRAALAQTQAGVQIAATQTAAKLEAQIRETQASYARLATQQSAALAREQARQDEQERRARQAAEWWETLRDAIKWFFIVLGVIVLFTVAVWGWTWVDLRKEQIRAQLVGQSLRPVGDGWAQWDGRGFKLIQLPAPEGEAAGRTTDESKRLRWRQDLRKFCYWGDRVGFGLRDMVRAGIVSDPDWRLLTKALKSAGVLDEVTLTTKGKAHPGTWWAAGWDYATFMQKLAGHQIAIPLPEELPVVRETVPT